MCCHTVIDIPRNHIRIRPVFRVMVPVIFQNEFFASVLTPSYTILLSKDVEINIKPCEITTKNYNSANNSLKNCKKERLLLSQKAFLFGGEAGI